MATNLSPESLLTQIPTSFATVSIGSDSTPLFQKLSAISSAGFEGIELGFPDLVTYASQSTNSKISEDDYPALTSAAKEVAAECTGLGLKIMMLQPFSNFEGWPKGSKQREDAFARAKGWIEVMEAAGCDLLQVGSSDSVGIIEDRDEIVNDLRELADLLAEKGFRLAYENWCWSTHAPTWADAWDIVQRIDRPNVGLCLDTFQSAGGEWGDPTTSSGRLETLSAQTLESQWITSLEQLTKTIPPEKIFLLQLSDAYKPPEPLSTEPDKDGLRPRGRWSHDFRPLPFAEGGYLPIVQFTKAVLGTGFRGWFSMEIFDGMGGKKEREEEMEVYARKAMSSHKRLVEEASR